MSFYTIFLIYQKCEQFYNQSVLIVVFDKKWLADKSYLFEDWVKQKKWFSMSVSHTLKLFL